MDDYSNLYKPVFAFSACNKESIENDIPGEALQAILNEACIVVVEYIIMN